MFVASHSWSTVISRWPLYFVVAVLGAGCVPVTEPLSDRDKAEPDKRLLGKWELVDAPADLPSKGIERYDIDSPAVTGNPKGLMRAVCDGEADDLGFTFWFFTTTIAKHTYATIYLDLVKGGQFADFRKEGALEKWHGNDRRSYFIFKYTTDGDMLAVRSGHESALSKLMEEKIAETRYEGTELTIFKTPSGWLAKYLEKNGPQSLYSDRFVHTYRRTKK